MVAIVGSFTAAMQCCTLIQALALALRRLHDYNIKYLNDL